MSDNKSDKSDHTKEAQRLTSEQEKRLREKPIEKVQPIVLKYNAWGTKSLNSPFRF